MNILGLIPARGGSKAIKNKNITNLAGKPLISYVIEALKNSNVIDKIVCTTDSKKIAQVASNYGAEVPFLRPVELAQDSSPIYSALQYTVKKLEELRKYKPDYIVTAQPTYPLMRPEHIRDAVQLAIEKNADSVVSVVHLDHVYHPYNIREILSDGRIKFWKEVEHYQFPNRQSKPRFYNFGNLIVSSYNIIVNEGKLEGMNNYPLEIDKISSLDIDDKEDLKLVEFLIKNKFIK